MWVLRGEEQEQERITSDVLLEIPFFYFGSKFLELVFP